jgi:hypothetical protein
MRYHVHCHKCPLDVYTPNEIEATALRRRHHGLVGHRPDITRILDTPHEGLLGAAPAVTPQPETAS